jgi:predicted DNA-binding protein YlxM (UPF0122 family)
VIALSFLLRHWKVASTAIAIIALFGGLFLWGQSKYRQGYVDAEDYYLKKIAEANTQSRKNADDVKREIQSLDTAELDNRLCGLGIVRESDGCN